MRLSRDRRPSQRMSCLHCTSALSLNYLPAHRPDGPNITQQRLIYSGDALTTAEPSRSNKLTTTGKAKQTTAHLRPTPDEPAKLPRAGRAREDEGTRVPCKRGSQNSALAPYSDGFRPHALIPPPSPHRRWASQLAAESSSWSWGRLAKKHARGWRYGGNFFIS